MSVLAAREEEGCSRPRTVATRVGDEDRRGTLGAFVRRALGDCTADFSDAEAAQIGLAPRKTGSNGTDDRLAGGVAAHGTRRCGAVAVGRRPVRCRSHHRPRASLVSARRADPHRPRRRGDVRRRACAPLCSRPCTRWRWPASPGTPATAATRGAACSGRASSSPPPRSVRATSPSAPSPACAPSIARSAASPPTAGRTAPTTRTCCAGSTSPRSTASCAPTAASVPQPLTAQQRDEYVAEVGFVSAKLGVVDPPQSVAELREALAAYRPELRGTPEARDTARFLLLNPPVPLLARPAYGLIVGGRGVDAAGLGAADAASPAAAADRRRPRRPGRRRAGHAGLPLDAGGVAEAAADLTRRKHCGNRRETGPPYGGRRAAEPPPSRPSARRQATARRCARTRVRSGAAISTTSRRDCCAVSTSSPDAMPRNGNDPGAPPKTETPSVRRRPPAGLRIADCATLPVAGVVGTTSRSSARGSVPVEAVREATGQRRPDEGDGDRPDQRQATVRPGSHPSRRRS